MAEIKNMPAIRFKSFSEVWEEKQIADLCSETTGGGTPKTTESKYWNGDIPWLQSSDLVENQLSNVVYRKTITDHGLKSSATKLVPADSIAIITRVGVGKLALIPYQFSTSQDFLSLSYLKVDKWFGAYSIWKKIQSELHAVQGTSIKGITKEELLSKRALIAKERKEQTQIGSYFQHLDKLISLHQAKVNKLTNLKKAMLEKMFPKQGADMPEIRFKGFAGAWDEVNLGEIANVTTGKLDANAMKSDGEFDFYTSGIQKYKIDVAAFIGPAITIAGNGATVGYMHLADGRFNAYQRTYVLTEFDACREFLFRSIGKALPHKISHEARTGNIPYIVLDMLTELKLLLPSLHEQEKIGTYFQNLDKTINLHQTELEKLTNLKKACLEKMFI